MQYQIEHILTTKERFLDENQLIEFNGQGSKDQITLSLGNFLYGHLVENSTLASGVYHAQGSYLGALVTGSHETPNTAGECGNPDIPVDAKCGYMCQQPTSYHLHWGFIPSGDYFTVEGWTLNIQTKYWNKGADYVKPGGYMLAAWSDNPVWPTPGPTVTPGGPTVTPGVPYVGPTGGGKGPSIWDGFIAGMARIVDNQIAEIGMVAGEDARGQIDPNSGRNYITLALSGFRIFIRTAYVLLRSNLDLRITIIVVTYILLLEPIRWLAAMWQWISNKIPFV